MRAPHQYEKKVVLKNFPHPLRTRIQSLRTLGQLLKLLRWRTDFTRTNDYLAALLKPKTNNCNIKCNWNI